MKTECIKMSYQYVVAGDLSGISREASVSIRNIRLIKTGEFTDCYKFSSG
jgi:hypothetical protein